MVTAGEIVVRRAGPILKRRVIEALSARFNARVELDVLAVSLWKGLEVSGEGLRICPPQEQIAGEPARPLIAVRRFSFHAGLRGLFVRPMHVALVQVTGLEVYIPPRQARPAPALDDRRRTGMDFDVERILCLDSALTLDTADPRKEPKRFALQRIELTSAGAGNGWAYDAMVVNALPRGEIHAVGHFGPWNAESPGSAGVEGHYTFDRADLGTIRGIAGTLSSVGDFQGQLDRIEVTGVADVPAFSLDTARQPVPLQAKFHAIVDGLTGDTYLQPVQARLRNSAFTCRGSVVNVRGRGHVTDLDVEVPDGYVQDFLALAVKTRPVLMTGHMAVRARLHLPYGREGVMHRLQVSGTFTLRQVRFTNARWQQEADELSLRTQGRPAEAKPGAPDVPSEMKGKVVLAAAKMNFSEIDYTMPGVGINLQGTYSLDGEEFDFQGDARTQAKPSEMVQSWWKQLLLKPVDHFITRGDAGLVLPITVSGTKADPKIGLDLQKMHFGHGDGSTRDATAK